MTVIDDRHLIDRPAANATVLETIDADAAFAAICEAVAACPSRDYGWTSDNALQ
jgi:hypothetical protein